MSDESQFGFVAENSRTVTLREKVVEGWTGCGVFEVDYVTATKNIAHLIAILEDTGSPAHMRVAAELRGE